MFLNYIRSFVRRPTFHLYNNHKANKLTTLISRTFSLKVKSSVVIDKDDLCDKKVQNNISKSSIIQVDEQKLYKLSKDIEDSLITNHHLKNVENVWKDIPPLTVPDTLEHYSKLTKAKLTGFKFIYKIYN